MREMDRDELEHCLAELNWDRRKLADVLGVDKRTVEKWWYGERSIPNPVALVVRMMSRSLDSQLQAEVTRD